MTAIYLDVGLWLTVTDPDLWLQPGEERTLRSCIMIDPADSAMIETIQRLLGDL